MMLLHVSVTLSVTLTLCCSSSTIATLARRTTHPATCLPTCRSIRATPRPWATWSLATAAPATVAPPAPPAAAAPITTTITTTSTGLYRHATTTATQACAEPHSMALGNIAGGPAAPSEPATPSPLRCYIPRQSSMPTRGHRRRHRHRPMTWSCVRVVVTGFPTDFIFWPWTDAGTRPVCSAASVDSRWTERQSAMPVTAISTVRRTTTGRIYCRQGIL